MIMTHANTRFRDIPSFGRATIRRFSHDVTAMKKLAAHDYEDILQVSGVAFKVWQHVC
jgi:hypothetical protein